MSPIPASPFSTIRVHPTSRGLHYSEPLSGFNRAISAEEFLVEQLRFESLSPQHKRRMAECVKWWRRGWNKSLDLLLASRAPRHSKNTGKDNLRSADGIPGRLYETPPSALRPTISLRRSWERRPNRGGDLEAALIRRKSARSFSMMPVALTELADILGGLYGAQNDSLFSDAMRYVYSVIFVFGVKGIKPGMYLYSPGDHSLRTIRRGNYRRAICRTVSGMPSAKTAAFAVLFCPDIIPFIESRGTERALRDLYFVLGIISQRLLIGASRLEIMGVVSPALQDRYALRQTSALDRTILPMYSAVLGRKKRKAGRISLAG